MFKGRRPSIPKNFPKSVQGEGVFFSAVVRVQEKLILEGNKENSLVELKFSQFDNYRWEDIVEEFNERRRQINETLNKAKICEK